MSDTLKGLLIIASVLTVGWILRKIRKNKVKMEDAIFWIFFAAILLLLAIFPEISYELCRIFGIMSPSNLVFLVIMGLPIMAMEFAVGRASRRSIAGSFHVLEPKGSKWHWYS